MIETIWVSHPDIKLTSTEPEVLGLEFINAMAAMAKKTSEIALSHEMKTFDEAIEIAKELIEVEYQITHEVTDYEEKLRCTEDKQEIEQELQEFCTAHGLDIQEIKKSALEDYLSDLLRDVTIAARNLERLNTTHIFEHITPDRDQTADKLRRRVELTKIIDKGIHFGIFVDAQS